MKFRIGVFGLVLSLCLLGGVARSADADTVPQVQLAQHGQALMKVVVAKDASQVERDAADNLAAYLSKISGATFQVVAGDGKTGIAVGTVQDFSALKLGGALNAKGAAGREQYLLRSHDGGVYIIGATPLAVQHGVWELLYRLGYRQFFPGETWEYIPHRADLHITVNVVEQPDYLFRNIRAAYGFFGQMGMARKQWNRRNRLDSNVHINWGHAYGNIISANREAFAKHPEYLGLLSDNDKPHGGELKRLGLIHGNRKSDKLNVGNPGLQKLVVQYAVDYFKAHTDATMISMSPSDGGGWGHDPASVAIGTPSDRALFLANLVAQGLRKHGFGDKYVGLYAYASTSAPPTRVHADPNVVIGVATAFIKGGYTADDILKGWEKMGVKRFGMREYYSIWQWANDMPRASRASHLAYLKQTIPHFYHEGARYMDAEAGTQWRPCGLGFYLASRMLWNVDEAQHMDALIDDFLDKMFGQARAPMARFYDLINTRENTLPERLSDDMVGRMYRRLDEAMKLAQRPEVRRRIESLALYTHYVELFRELAAANGKDGEQAARENLVKYVFRIRKRRMLQTVEMYRRLDKHAPKNCKWNVPIEKNPWKQSKPYTHEEVLHIIAEGIKHNPLKGFTAKTFSHDMVPATPILGTMAVKAHKGKDAGEVGGVEFNTRGLRRYYTWIDRSPTAIHLKVTGGLVTWYRDRGNVRITLYALKGGHRVEQDHDQSVPPDGKAHDVVLHATQTGLHVVVINDGMDRTRIAWPEGLPVTFEESAVFAPHKGGRWGGVFYVPQGTRVIGLYLAKGPDHSEMIRPDGTVVSLYNVHGYFKVPVPPGQDGKIWRLRSMAGKLRLLTVPPYIAPTPGDLLLPREVVEADAAKK